ncbi:MAG: hypothetical protein PHW65_00030 [Dehalococcoidales bacterium]|nr:hypothetical protein [Dehalococcoidales bacterium]
MSVFNYKTRVDTVESLSDRVARIERLLNRLQFWEVNDITLGVNVLRRRRVSPNTRMGGISRGQWHDVTGLNYEYGGGTDSATASYDNFAFGFSISGAVVTVNGGYVFHGMRSPITVSGGDITIAADNTYIYVTYVFGSGAAFVTSSTAFPQHTATTLNWLLYMAELSDGVVTIDDGNIHHLGSITIPGAFA